MAQPRSQSFSFVGADMWLSEFRLLPTDPAWRRTNVIGSPFPLIAFPRTTVGIQHQGRGEVVADPMCAVVYPPEQSYRRRAITSVGDECTALVIAPAVAAEVAHGYDGVSGVPSASRFPFVASALTTDDYLAIQRIRALVASSDDGHEAEIVREELYWIVNRVLTRGYADGNAARQRKPATDQAHAEIVDAVRERIGRELHVTRALDEIAAAVNVSPFHLARTFRERTGRSIHGYRMELRVRASLALIADGVRLADVAQQLGFASHAHLTDRFRRVHRMAPEQWRNTLSRRANSSTIMEAAD